MRILLAEDDRDLNKALTWQLTGQGYNVDSCYDGEDALYYGKQNIYDVILLDRMLPFQEGTEVLSSLRRHGVTAPVILITALGALKDKILGLDLGADDYLSKPFGISHQLTTISHGPSVTCACPALPAPARSPNTRATCWKPSCTPRGRHWPVIPCS